MHYSSNLRPRRRARTPSLVGALLAVGLFLTACGITDEVGTNFNIAFDSDWDESLASIGVLQIGEPAQVTFQVKKAGQEAINRTAEATFELTDRQASDNAGAFNFVESPDLATQPYHTVSTYLYDVQATICATYDGPEVIEGPVEVCRIVMTLAEEDYQN